MGIREDIQVYLADYRGILGWNSYTEVYTSTIYPHIEIPLYVQESGIPIRKNKMTEISTMQTLDPGSHIETTTQALFFGPPDILQVELNGWTVTPTANSRWAPVDASGSPLNWGQVSYNDIIGYFVEGRFNRNSAGTWIRKDPDYYISPRGQKYSNPVIAMYQPTASAVQKKQSFDMVLWLES